VKAAPFAYVRPGSVPDVVAELAAGASPSGAEGDDSGGDAKILAGGQSLMPVLAMRLGRPGLLVDINAVPALASITPVRDLSPAPDPPSAPDPSPAASPGSETVTIGATVRQRDAQSHPATAAVPLLRMALPWVGHREIRGRGTVCGSLAHADPAAELPTVACCLAATMIVVSVRGRRSVAARDFFAGPLTTVLEPDELLESVSFPAAVPGEGFGFAEVARRHGDFALAGVTARVRVTTSGDRTGSGEQAGVRAIVGCFGVADRPVLRDVSDWVAGVVATGEVAEVALRARFAADAGDFAAEVVTTSGDQHGSTGYRRRLIREMTAVELARATARALTGGER
jgi:carbon-monoxide dehydrogenase medium subunit